MPFAYAFLPFFLLIWLKNMELNEMLQLKASKHCTGAFLIPTIYLKHVSQTDTIEFAEMFSPSF